MSGAATRISIKEVSGTGSGSAQMGVVAHNPQRQFLQVVNNDASNSLTFSLGSVVPAVNSTGVTLYPGGSYSAFIAIPIDQVNILGTAAYCIWEG